MSFFDIKDPEERDAVIEDYLALKKQLKECNIAEHGYLADQQSDLEETSPPVVTSNEKMAQDIKDNRRIEINRNIEMKKKVLRPQIDSKQSFLPKYMDDAVDRLFGICYESGHFMMYTHILGCTLRNVLDADNLVLFAVPSTS